MIPKYILSNINSEHVFKFILCEFKISIKILNEYLNTNSSLSSNKIASYFT